MKGMCYICFTSNIEVALKDGRATCLRCGRK